MNSNINSILENGEVITWRGKVSRKVLNFGLILGFLAWLLFSGFLLIIPPANELLAILASLVLLAVNIIKFSVDYVKVFTITDKRIIIKSGIIGTDYNSIYFTEIKTVNVRVDLIDKIFAVGTINIDTGKVETVTNKNQSKTQTAYDRLVSIDNPYEVYKILQSNLSGRQESLYSGRADKLK